MIVQVSFNLKIHRFTISYKYAACILRTNCGGILFFRLDKRFGDHNTTNDNKEDNQFYLIMCNEL